MNQEIEITFKKGTRIEQIERSCFYLFSIFAALDSDPISDEHPLPSNAIADFSHIGAAFTDSIYRNISDFIEPDEDKELNKEFIEIKPIKSETDDLLEISHFHDSMSDRIDILAAVISGLIKNPHLPPPLAEKFKDALQDFFNDDIIQTEINEFHDSPEYILRILHSYKKDDES